MTSRRARFKAMGIAIGFAEVVLDLARVVNTSAEAPSLIADAFAAVTVPSFLSLSMDKRRKVLEDGF